MTATKTRPWTAPNEPYLVGEEWKEKPGFELRSYKPFSRDKHQRINSLLRLYRSASTPSHASEMLDVLGQGRVTCKVATFDKSFRSETVEWLQEAVQFLSSYPSATYQHRLTGPVQFLQKLLRTWRLEPTDAVPLLGLEASDPSVAVRLLSGREPLRGRDVKDRIAYLFRIRKALSALFRNEDAENDWLREPHDLLAGQKPITLLLEGSMENLLLVKEYVEAAAER